MFRCFYPKEWIDSTYSIDFKKYYDCGYRCVLFDIDNTLVCHGAPANEQSIKLIKGLMEMGFSVMFISNNKEPRVKSFNDCIGADYIYKAGKPNPSGYLKGMEKAGGTAETTLFVGDQLFTDIWGANRAGIYSILVKPIDKHEEIQIVLKRRLEWIVLAAYKHHLKTEAKNAQITGN